MKCAMISSNLLARAGIPNRVVDAKLGVRAVVAGDETLVLGGACAEIATGPRLAALVRPGHEKEALALARLEKDEPTAPLSVHTSIGHPGAVVDVLRAIEPHVPASWTDDWRLSLQLDGASAVRAACDLLLRQCDRFAPVAVGMESYHGPPSSSVGGVGVLDRALKPPQLSYPIPSPFRRRAGEADGDFNARVFDEFRQFCKASSPQVVVFEPQWGSSLAAMPWPVELLRACVAEARESGAKVLCDEVMCGMARHGLGRLFLSDAWRLDPDAISLGKALGAGVNPIAGVLVRHSDAPPLEIHTYAGASERALMAAAATLDALGDDAPLAAAARRAGDWLAAAMEELQAASRGRLLCHGLGLMRGAIFAHRDAAQRARFGDVFRANCERRAVLPYHVPVGGFMITPPYDVDLGTLEEGLRRIGQALDDTYATVRWDDAGLAT
ncbi:hypothetical protein CTAYLR_002152 [Chrysophaeum taylorii]|uniref:Uncharacterized protein n=1 Tax=Chrysophaeum taylorii TaxID=2483200 RepID=A0AAD7UPV9_9STRA|nr:hypothetical protein CTAYLR_002152 [Chrysophaeum taylorii]